MSGVKWGELLRFVGALTAAGLLGGGAAGMVRGGGMAEADDVARLAAAEAKSTADRALVKSELTEKRIDEVVSAIKSLTDKQEETNKALNQLIGAINARPRGR